MGGFLRFMEPCLRLGRVGVHMVAEMVACDRRVSHKLRAEHARAARAALLPSRGALSLLATGPCSCRGWDTCFRPRAAALMASSGNTATRTCILACRPEVVTPTNTSLSSCCAPPPSFAAPSSAALAVIQASLCMAAVSLTAEPRGLHVLGGHVDNVILRVQLCQAALHLQHRLTWLLAQRAQHSVPQPPRPRRARAVRRLALPLVPRRRLCRPASSHSLRARATQAGAYACRHTCHFQEQREWDSTKEAVTGALGTSVPQYLRYA